jgi:hypothetical protein
MPRGMAFAPLVALRRMRRHTGGSRCGFSRDQYRIDQNISHSASLGSDEPYQSLGGELPREPTSWVYPGENDRKQGANNACFQPRLL